jgi:Domain of unknown function (DU1801)
MLRPIDNYFLNQDEPTKSCLQFLREHILQLDKNITETWKYGAPFYNIYGKRFCYLWTHKKFKLPYIGIIKGLQINHPDLLQEKRVSMKILLIDPMKDIPLARIDKILKEVLSLYI